MPRKTGTKTTLLLASMLTVMASAMVSPALPRIEEAFQQTEGVQMLTRMVLSVPAIFIAVSGFLVGPLIGRIGKLPTLFGACLLYAVAGGAPFVLDNLHLILASRAILGMAVAGIMTIATTLIGDYFVGDERNRFMGVQASFMALGGAVFVMLSGFLADMGWRYPFLVYLFSLVVLVLGMVFLHEPAHSQQPELEKEQPQSYPRFPVYTVLASALISMLVFYLIPVQLPFLLEVIGYQKSVYTGQAMLVSTLVGAVMGFAYGHIRRKLHFAHIYALAFFLQGAGIVSAALSPSFGYVAASMVLVGMGTGLLMPNGSLWMMNLAPPQLRGKFIGQVTSAIFLGQFLSPFFSQPISEEIGLPATYLGGGLFAMALSLLYLALKPRLQQAEKRHQPPQPEPALS